MPDIADGTGSAHPSAEEVRQLLERILCSRQFSNAPKKRKFLQLICEAYLDGRASELSEYSIGYEVFDRKETYDPALDSIVRVGAHEVRKKLECYTKAKGKMTNPPGDSGRKLYPHFHQTPAGAGSYRIHKGRGRYASFVRPHWPYWSHCRKDLDHVVEPGVGLFDNCRCHVGSIQLAITAANQRRRSAKGIRGRIQAGVGAVPEG